MHLTAQMFARRSNQVARGPRSKTQVLASKLQVHVINTTTNYLINKQLVSKNL
jgi:hypothetical protein